MELPKYCRWEHERKFLVHRDSFALFSGKPYWVIEDKYLDCGRLRLRSIAEIPSGKTSFKLCKKFESLSAYSTPMVNIYLSQQEYEGLKVVSGQELIKHRYHDSFKGRTFGIDFFEKPLESLAMCEIECDSEADLMSVEWPDYAVREVTTNSFFTGGNLCRVTADELMRSLKGVL